MDVLAYLASMRLLRFVKSIGVCILDRPFANGEAHHR